MSFESWELRHRHVQIALSYRPVDAQLAAWPIFERLRTEFGRERVWFDGIGGDEDGVLYAGSAACVLLLVGPAWLRSDLFDPADAHRREIEAALANPHTFLAPVLVGGADWPPAEALPRSLRVLPQLASLRLESGPRHQAQAARLMARIRTHLTRAAA